MKKNLKIPTAGNNFVKLVILPLKEVTYMGLVSLLLAFQARFQVVLVEFLQACMYSKKFFFLTGDSYKLEKLKSKTKIKEYTCINNINTLTLAKC